MKSTVRKFTNLTIVLSLLIISSNFAQAVENEPVAGAEVVLSTFDDNGNLVPLGDPVDTNPDGTFNAELPAGFPPHKPVFAVVQDKDGQGVPNVSCVSPNEPAQVDPASTAIGNAFLSFANETGDFNPQDADASQVENFVKTMKEAIKDVPPAETAGDSITRFADAMGLHPEAFLDAVSDFNVDPADKIRVAAMINDAAAPQGFNPLDGKPPKLPDDIPAGSHIPGLIPPEFLEKFAPPDFDFHEEFGEGVLPPGGLIGEIPPGSFLMPPGLEANPDIPFGEEPFFPQGVKIPGDFPMPPEAHLPPGIIFEEGFIPPAGLPIPPGFIGPPGFDPAAFGAIPLEEFNAPDDFRPAPGFGLVDGQGGFGMPPGFAIPEGVQLPPEALEFPPPAGFEPPPLPPGFEQDFIPPFPAGFAFNEGAHLPPGFDPVDFGLQRPPNFVEHDFGGPVDFEEFKADDFVAFDPFKGFKPDEAFGGFFGPPLDANGNPIPGAFDPFAPPPPGGEHPGQFPDDFDPFAPFKEGEPPPGGNFDPNQPPPDGNFDPNKPPPADGNFDPNQPPPDGNFDPNQPPPADGNFDPNQPPPADGNFDPNQPPPDNGGAVPPPPGNDPGAGQPPADNGGAVPPPPANDPNAGQQPPPPPPPPPANDPAAGQPPPQLNVLERVKIDTRNTRQIIAKSGENSLVVVSAPEGTNAKRKKGRKITASEGVYLTGKVKASAANVQVPVIIDPSITAESVKVTLSVNNKVETTDVDIVPGAVQLITQLEGNVIEMSTANTEVDIEAKKVRGFLLAPGTSAVTMQKAIKVKGKISEGESGDIISFKLPKKSIADGVYTITFRDGLDLYYGKVTIGELEVQTISGTVLAPGGQL